MMDQVREGFRPDFAVLVEFIDSDDLSTSWHLDHHAMHARRDDVHHGDFTGRTASVIEVAGCLGIWFESVRIQHRYVKVTDWSSNSFKWSLLDEPTLVAALRSEPTGDLLRPRWELTAWILLDVIGLMTVGVWCRSLAGVVQRPLRRSPPGQCCQSCGYDLTGLATSTCPECGVCITPAS